MPYDLSVSISTTRALFPCIYTLTKKSNESVLLASATRGKTTTHSIDVFLYCANNLTTANNYSATEHYSRVASVE